MSQLCARSVGSHMPRVIDMAQLPAAFAIRLGQVFGESRLILPWDRAPAPAPVYTELMLKYLQSHTLCFLI